MKCPFLRFGVLALGGLSILTSCSKEAMTADPGKRPDGVDAATASAGGRPTAPPLSEKEKAQLDPQMKAVLDAFAALKPAPLEKLSPKEARLNASMADAATAVMVKQGKMLPDVGIEDRKVPGVDNMIPARVYRPKNVPGPLPVVVYFHGGGWVIAGIDTYDASCRAIAKMANCVVISVGYRQSPEYKFPVPSDDCYAATQWVMDHTADLDGDPKRVAVAGESAGGNLATVVCLMARDKGGKMPVAQVLVYPVCDMNFDTASYQENATATPLSKPMMQWFFNYYLKSPSDGDNVYVSPLRDKGDLGKLPPTTVITAQIDPLMSEGKAYADKLRAAGVAVRYQNFDGVTHEFFGMGLVVDKAMRAEEFAVEGLKTAFGTK